MDRYEHIRKINNRYAKAIEGGADKQIIELQRKLRVREELKRINDVSEDDRDALLYPQLSADEIARRRAGLAKMVDTLAEKDEKKKQNSLKLKGLILSALQKKFGPYIDEVGYTQSTFFQIFLDYIDNSPIFDWETLVNFLDNGIKIHDNLSSFEFEFYNMSRTVELLTVNIKKYPHLYTENDFQEIKQSLGILDCALILNKFLESRIPESEIVRPFRVYTKKFQAE